MALESQGVVIKMADGTIATASDTGLEFNATGINTANTDLSVDFSAGMRIKSNSTLCTSIFTASTVDSSAISIFETATIDTSSAFNHLNGYTMNAIGQVISFSGPSGVAAIIDVTNLASTAKEKLIGIRDEGQLTFEINYSATVTDLHSELRDERTARSKRFYEIELTDGTTAGSFLFFEAYVTGFSLSAAVDDAIKGSVTLEIASEVHWIKSTR